MWDRRDALLALSLSLLSFALFLTYWDTGVYDDEGYLVVAVQRIAAGEVPYRDFHHTYAPGRFYLVDLLFRVFGEDLLVVRALWLVLRASIVFLAYAAGRRLLSRPAAVAAALLFVAAPGPWHKSFFHLALLTNALALSALVGRGGRRAAALAGFVAGLSFLFRQDVGIFAAGIYVIFLLFRRWSGEDWRRGAAFFLFALLPLLPFLIYFASVGALAPAAEKVLLGGMRDNRTNTIPFPPLFHPLSAGLSGVGFFLLRLLYYLPLPLYAVTLAVGAIRFFRGKKEGKSLVVLSLLGFLSFNQTLWRSDLPHLLQSLAPFYLLLPWWVGRLGGRRALARALLTLALPPLLFLLMMNYSRAYGREDGARRIFAEGIQPLPPYYTGSAMLAGGEKVRLRFPRAPLRASPEEAAYLYALEEIVSRYSGRGDYILTLPGRQLLYFLFERRNPTEFIHLRRAFDSEEEETKYLEDLLDHPTKLVLLWDTAIDGREERRLKNYAPRLFRAIESEFQEVRTLGNLVVYRREGSMN